MGCCNRICDGGNSVQAGQESSFDMDMLKPHEEEEMTPVPTASSREPLCGEMNGDYLKVCC